MRALGLVLVLLSCAACTRTRTGATDASATDPRCAKNGCLRSATKLGDYTAAALRPLVDPRVKIENGYSVWSIEYVTNGATSLATVTIPHPLAPPPGGYAIVANNHGTVGLDDPCTLTNTVYGAGLAGLFGAHGLIGVAPDYPGLGTKGLLPYLVSEVEGAASLDALRAAKELAASQGVPLSNRYAVAGLSEGGHATIAAAAMHATYAPELDIRGFAAAAPASVFEEDWRAGFVDGPAIVFEAMLFYAWRERYGASAPSPFLDDERVKRAMTKACIGTIGNTSGIPVVLGTSERAQIFAPAFIEAFTSAKWGPYEAYGKAFTENRLRPYKSTAPLRVYQGDADVIVLEPKTRAFVDTLRAGGVDVSYEVVPGATHFDLAFGFVAVPEKRTEESIAWIKERVR